MSFPALLVVDVQVGFINKHTSHIPNLINSLIDHYEVTYATRFYNPPSSNYRRLMNWGRFGQGSEELELAFKPRINTHIIDKPVYTCVKPDFVRNLSQQGIYDIHIVGIDTDICVMKCAVDLFEAGFCPHVLANYCASHGGPYFHEAGLNIISRYIGSKQVVR
jgi:nicotinamidase-related amidase